jgi:CheY-like chemotaxis protein
MVDLPRKCPNKLQTGKAIVMEMSCEEICREVPHYIRGNLSAELRACIEEHLKGCKHCTAALGGTGTVGRLIGDVASDLREGRTHRSDQKLIRTQEQARKSTTQRTVLYVDDNPRALRILTFALEWTGYKVIPACNCEALERMKQSSPDLVLLAHRVPQMIASTLAPEIKQMSPGIPTLLFSGRTLLPSEELSYVNAYVGNGATLDDLLTQIKILIDLKT